MPAASSVSLRERTRRSVQAEITTTAVQLFTEQGFDATTIDQITQATGISRRSFFRYFGTKEDIVLGDVGALGQRVRASLEARPASEPAWTALRAAFASLRDTSGSAQDELALARIYHEAPSLRARHLEKHLAWQELLAPDIERRLGIAGGPSPDPRARAVIAAALSCLDVAVEAWRASDGTADVVQLFDDAVAAVRTGAGASPE